MTNNQTVVAVKNSRMIRCCVLRVFLSAYFALYLIDFKTLVRAGVMGCDTASAAMLPRMIEPEIENQIRDQIKAAQGVARRQPIGESFSLMLGQTAHRAPACAASASCGQSRCERIAAAPLAKAHYIQVKTYSDYPTKNNVAPSPLTRAGDRAPALNLGDDDSRLTMEYDFFNRMIRQKQAGFTAEEFTIEYDYDAAGNRTMMRHSKMSAGTQVAYEYDNQNRVTSISDQFGEVVNFDYDTNGNRVHMDRNGGKLVSTWNYDEKDRVTDIEHSFSSDPLDPLAPRTLVSFFRYAYNNVDNRTSMTDRHGRRDYAYDELDRLTGVLFTPSPTPPLAPSSPSLSPSTYNDLNETFAYDPVGNRSADKLTGSYAYDNGNRITTDGTYLYTFDANGNQVEKQLVNTTQADADTPGKVQYIYDGEDRLVEVRNFNTGQGPVADQIVKFRYDGLGRRIEKRVLPFLSPSPTPPLAPSAHLYFYDEEDIVVERVTAASPLERLVDLDVPIRTAVRDGNHLYAATSQGVRVVDLNSGDVVTWSMSGGQLASNDVRDVYLYDTSRDRHWDRSAQNKTWSLFGEFPEKVLVVATDIEVTLINAATGQKYARFELAAENGLTNVIEMDGYMRQLSHMKYAGHVPIDTDAIEFRQDTMEPNQVLMHDGQLLVDMMPKGIYGAADIESNDTLFAKSDVGANYIVIDFRQDKIIVEDPNDVSVSRQYLGGVGQANGGLDHTTVGRASYHYHASATNTPKSELRLIDTGETTAVLQIATGLREIVNHNPFIPQADLQRGAEGAVVVTASAPDGTLLGGSSFICGCAMVEDMIRASNGDIYTCVYQDPKFIFERDRVIQGGKVTVRGTGFLGLININTGRPDAAGATNVARNIDELLRGRGGAVGTNADDPGNLLQEGTVYQPGINADAFNTIEPLTVDVMSGVSTKSAGANRVYVGTRDGFTLVDESVGDTLVDAGNSEFDSIPWSRTNEAVSRKFYPRTMTNARIKSDQVDQIDAMSADRVLTMNYEFGQIAIWDFSVNMEDGQNMILHGPGIDEPLVLRKASPDDDGGSDYYLTDGLGSVTETVGAAGLFSNEMMYRAYGGFIFDWGPPQPYAFTGREFDSEVSLYFFRARYYDSYIGRFLQKEPRINDINANKYAYIHPVNFIDPLGLFVIGVEIGGTLGTLATGILGSVGFAIDDNGNYGTYSNIGIYGGLAVGVAGGVSFIASNADTIFGLSGASFIATGGAAAPGTGGVLGTLSISKETIAFGTGLTRIGRTYGAFLGIGAGASVTDVDPLGNVYDSAIGRAIKNLISVFNSFIDLEIATQVIK